VVVTIFPAYLFTYAPMVTEAYRARSNIRQSIGVGQVIVFGGEVTLCAEATRAS
jgi:hypothetical protein